ncbi:hypothetical protein HWV62_31127 [Athelia sp. TMB]|nr:hypothetical protein HWV62_31127 [Athelia sp. TMB]
MGCVNKLLTILNYFSQFSIMSQSMWKDTRLAKLYRSGERISGPPAGRLIEQAGLLGDLPTRPLVIFDNACGTGITASLLYKMVPEENREGMTVMCGDISSVMVGATQERIEVNGWAGAKAQVVDGMKTGFPDNHFSHALTNFGIMLMPEPVDALAECLRILQPGGTCGLSTWQSIGWIPDVQAAIATIQGAPPFPDAHAFGAAMIKGDWHDPSFVEATLKRSGFESVVVNTARHVANMGSPEVHADLFSGMLPNMLLGSKAWTNDDVERYGKLLAPALARYYKDRDGEGKDVEFEMVAVIATAQKPAAA